MKKFVLLTSILLAFAAGAQQGSQKPIRILSAFPTGLAPDNAARAVANRLTTLWGRTVQVEPMPGASGLLAINAVKRAPADGSVLLLASNGHFSINPILQPSLGYDGERDFVPVSQLYSAPFFLYVSATGPYKTIKDLLDKAKTGPDVVSYSSAYVGSPLHLGGATLAHLSNTSMLAVHYKEFSPALSAVVSGDVDFILATKGSGNSLVQAGRLKRLAAATPQRIASEPDVPTIKEAGGPDGLNVVSWLGLFAPAGTPAEVVKKYADDIAKVLAEPEIRKSFAVMGVEPAAAGSAEVAVLVKAELASNRELIKRIGIKPE